LGFWVGRLQQQIRGDCLHWNGAAKILGQTLEFCYYTKLAKGKTPTSYIVVSHEAFTTNPVVDSVVKRLKTI
jgi:hypothetical protein